MRHPLQVSCLTVLVLVFPPASAATEPEGLAHPCAAVREDADRLACYDSAFGRPGAADPRPADAEPAAMANRDFGFSEAEKRVRYPDSARDKELDQIEATVVSISFRSTGSAVVTLDNGQVWEQAETLTSARLRAGDNVTIRKAALGSYRLLTPGKVAMRVRRLH